MAAALLLGLALAWGIFNDGLILLPGTRTLRSSLALEWHGIIGFPVLTYMLWILASFLTLGVARLFGNNSSFEIIFSVLAFGGAPCIVAWISLVLGGLGYVVYRCWQAHHDSISLVYGKWEDIRRIVGHEFSHVVRRHQITPEALSILDEGLAEYVADTLYPASRAPAITLAPNLHIVSNTSVFSEWTRTPKPALGSYFCYRHAHALADYLITRYGLPQYFELIREVAASKEPTEGTRLAAGVEKVYGMPLSQLEKHWRKNWPGTWRSGQTVMEFAP
jgi:hypothetical protein